MDVTWEAFRARYEGKKLITLSETGGIIVPDAVCSRVSLADEGEAEGPGGGSCAKAVWQRV